jgi:hypothetical protein
MLTQCPSLTRVLKNECFTNICDGAILPRFSTTGYAGYQIRIEEDPKVHDSPI